MLQDLFYNSINTRERKFYITTPIYYVNSEPHIGHAYTTIAADVLARYHRLRKEEVFFLTGTDEHGAKIAKIAQETNKTPLQLCDENSELFKKTWQSLNISYDNFIRTTDSSHVKSVQKTLQILYDKKFIYKGIYKGFYCLGCEQFKRERDLINGKCPDHQIKPEIIKEENYLFKLSQFENVLRKKIECDEFEIKPDKRKKEVLEFLKNGLRDISISRLKIKVKWGITIPFDKKHTTFVWIDAFLNYLTGLGWDGNPKNLPEFWPPDLQLMSKDILRVHTTIWPALLLALNLPLPKKLFVHGYFTFNGQKMSKSLGNVIRPVEMIEKFGIDGTRYLLLSACSFGEDGDITWERFIEKYNADLASGLGNLIARIIVMAEKTQSYGLRNKINDLEMKKIIQNIWQNYKKFLDLCELDKALREIWKLISFCDKYIEKKRPWEKSKNQLSVINDLLISLANIAQMLQPFLPETSKKIFKQLGVRVTNHGWYFKVKKEKVLFPRI
jgi:methionyl-tRNA synthetase